jgi:hypothetical protein
LFAVVTNGAVILNILARQRAPVRALTIVTPDALTLREAPHSDGSRYDKLRSLT